MAEVLIFGGTTEGRGLAEFCASFDVSTCVCIVSDYGEQLLPQRGSIKACTGALEQIEMEQLIRKEKPRLIFDATHPHAVTVSKNIEAACQKTGETYQRVLRADTDGGMPKHEIWVTHIDEAVSILEQDNRPVLVTTGSKELKAYTSLKHYQDRLFVRILASHEGIRACEEIGLSGSHMIAMQGPFSKKMNEALLEQINAGWLVTKESGIQGGFLEKRAAAAALHVKMVVIGRPEEKKGISLQEACLLIAGRRETMQREVLLIGIGMGNSELMTMEAVKAIQSCDALLGAPRMILAAEGLNPGGKKASMYHPAELCSWLREHPEVQKAGILLSGDTGFYSGAHTIKEALEQDSNDGWIVRTLPGISTVSYLCARLGTSWEDIHLCSMHGRDCDLQKAVRQHRRIFCLLGNIPSVSDVCLELQALSDMKFNVTVGEHLSYPEERIITGTPEEIAELKMVGMSAILIERCI